MMPSCSFCGKPASFCYTNINKCVSCSKVLARACEDEVSELLMKKEGKIASLQAKLDEAVDIINSIATCSYTDLSGFDQREAREFLAKVKNELQNTKEEKERE